MPDVDKLYEKAEKYLQKQKFEAAYETYQEISKYEPGEEEVLLNLAELALKLNRAADALRYQTQLMDNYIKRNDTSKAIVTCRKVLKLSPQDAATHSKLASLFEKSNKTSEALEAYREALELYRKAGALPQALDCLQHIVKLDPENGDACVEFGELAGKLRQPQLATPAFLKAAQLARQAGKEDRWAELVERAHLLDPQDEPASVAAAELYLQKDRAAESVALLETISQSKPEEIAILDLLAKAYLKTRDFPKAQPVCWKLYETRPEALGLVVALVEGFVQTGGVDKALALTGKLKPALFRQGKRSEFLELVEKMYEADESNLPVLEMLAGLYNEMNKEDGLRRSLTRLFNLYLAAEQYQKAADTLEQIIDVDPYGEGHYDRLLNLENHIDKTWYENIASRVRPPAATGAAKGSGPAAAQKAEGLDDLIIEGEMFQQYQLTLKLKETLEKINRLHPGAEGRNPRLRDLYDASGFKPTGQAASGPASAEPPPAPAPAGHRREQTAAELQSLDELRLISQITANIYREATPQGVMQIAVNEVGRALSSSRCWGALGASDRPPTLIVEYCAPAASASDVPSVLKLYALLMRQASAKPDGWLMEDVAQFPALSPVLSDVQKLGIKSLLALPLIDKDQPAGLLLVEQCDRRRAWTPGEDVLLKALSTQVIVAVNNTKLRRLVRSLAGADETTGLMPRSSYLDCLLAEGARAKDQSHPLSVCLIEPTNPTGLVRDLGDARVQRYLQQVSKALQANLRQNDIPIRYSPCTIAVLFPDTPLTQGGLAVEKLHRVIAQVKLDGAPPPTFCAAVCDVQIGPGFDAVDGVTEVINRLEAALEQSHKEGGQRVLLSKFES